MDFYKFMNGKAQMPKHRCQSSYILRRPQNLKIDSGGFFLAVSPHCWNLFKVALFTIVGWKKSEVWVEKKKNEVSILTQKFAIGVMPCAAYSLKRLFSLVFLWFQQPKLTKDDPERRLEFGESIIGLIERKGVKAVVGNLLTSDQSTIQLGAGPVGRTMVNHNMTF